MTSLTGLVIEERALIITGIICEEQFPYGFSSETIVHLFDSVYSNLQMKRAGLRLHTVFQ